ncbi:aldehyde dehydrogenase family protein [Streptomyces sp. AK02-01A]|uniref:aldehyde dehydrogenase family protein n=1 Tax=Streptomyces sp. AK02-01A TaxID=3028648 RepID=UPI0029A6E0C9|nr:aldehyde dehydrogenase family protein [Streptomyces sp. AK02-01A]MDX3849210.1 aldehyde dehydrogenase family protein [Streptomyces sp. AK02-01A]
MPDTLPLRIDGKDVPAADGATFAVHNPATGDHLFDVAHANAADVDAAVTAAKTAFEDRRWQGMRARDRARVLNRAAAELDHRIDEFARLETLQIGRPLREMRAQLSRLPEWLEYFGAVAHSAEGTVPDFGEGYLNVVHRVPLGVAGLITPWNHPLLITMKKLSAGLAAGNSLVIKPSELGPAVPVALAGLLEEAGVPAGVINVVTGLGPTTGRFLSEHPGLARLDITGGTETGRVVAGNAGRSLIPVTAELGGKAPVIVFDDTEIEQAVAGAMFASFIATGQTCVQGARLLVQRTVYERFVHRFVERTRSLRLGDPLAARTQVGPLVSRAQRDKTAAAVDRAREQGATVLCGGRVPEGAVFDRGWFYEPTVVAGVTPDHELWYDEVFGPVTVVVPFDDEADATAKANDCPFGLAASVWTADAGRALRVTDRLDIGIIWVNDHHRIDPSSPWGGTKDSGIGSENGLDAYRAYTRAKSVIINSSGRPFDWYATAEDLRYS